MPGEPTKTEVLSMRLDGETTRRIDKMAASESRLRAHMLAILLREALDARERKQKRVSKK